MHSFQTHNFHENQWDYYTVEGIMDTHARVSHFWVTVLTWMTNEANWKKQIIRVDRLKVTESIFNSKLICFSTIRGWSGSNQNFW